MLLHPAPISTSRFSYKDGVFSAEESDFGRDFRFGQVWDDACDIGLTLVSHVSGREVVFAFEREVRDREGEVMYLEFKPALRNQPNLTVRIYND